MTQETDLELLDMAAKAAGIEWYGIAGDGQGNCLYLDIGPDDVVKWNPLTDGGDALRLAVKLRLHISVFADAIGIGTPQRGYVETRWVDDPCAATRRAITHAAAEVGRAM